MEDYTKAIYALQLRGEQPVSTTALAQRLGVTAASASGMVKRLTELGLAASVLSLSGAAFPHALEHVSGRLVGAVFALGLIEAGAVAVLTISASTGYAVGECIGAPHSLNNSARGAALFYGANVGAALIAGVIILIPGVPLLSIALNANVLATVLLPVALVFMIMLASDRELMGEWANGVWRNRLSATIVGFIALCGGAYAVDSFLTAVHVL